MNSWPLLALRIFRTIIIVVNWDALHTFFQSTYQHSMYVQELLVYCIWFLSFCFCDCTIVVLVIGWSLWSYIASDIISINCHTILEPNLYMSIEIQYKMWDNKIALIWDSYNYMYNHQYSIVRYTLCTYDILIVNWMYRTCQLSCRSTSDPHKLLSRGRIIFGADTKTVRSLSQILTCSRETFLFRNILVLISIVSLTVLESIHFHI